MTHWAPKTRGGYEYAITGINPDGFMWGWVLIDHRKCGETWRPTGGANDKDCSLVPLDNEAAELLERCSPPTSGEARIEVGATLWHDLLSYLERQAKKEGA